MCKLSTTEAQLVEKLASEGIVKPPTIRFGGRTESFLFTPKPGGTRLNAANREIYERAMALISAVCKGQLLPNAYAIRSPVRILEKLRDAGHLGSNSEARDQYHNLVVLRVAHLKQTSSNRWSEHAQTRRALFPRGYFAALYGRASESGAVPSIVETKTQ
jgi:hypothetical protein